MNKNLNHKYSHAYISKLWTFCPLFFILLGWYIFWLPLQETADQFFYIDAQNYFQGFSRGFTQEQYLSVFSDSNSLSIFCWSWNDCLHTYIYSFFHNYLGGSLILSILLYFVFSACMRSVLHLCKFSSLAMPKIAKYSILIYIFCNPHFVLYSAAPSKELISVALVALVLDSFLRLRRHLLIGGKFKIFSFKTSLFVFRLFLFFSLGFLYRFQLVGLMVVIPAFFLIRGKAYINFKSRINKLFALGILLFVPIFAVAGSYVLQRMFDVGLSSLSDPLYALSPFNFPFFVNPAIIKWFTAVEFPNAYPFAAATQLCGFFLLVLLLFVLYIRVLSWGSLFLIISASMVGLLYGDNSSRYVMLVSYFAFVSMVVDCIWGYKSIRSQTS